MKHGVELSQEETVGRTVGETKVSETGRRGRSYRGDRVGRRGPGRGVSITEAKGGREGGVLYKSVSNAAVGWRKKGIENRLSHHVLTGNPALTPCPFFREG